MAGPVYKRAENLLEAGIGVELVALDVEAGECFGFNEVATSIWRSLDTPKSFDQLRNALLDEYDVSAEQCSVELRTLLDDLVANRLLAVEPDPS